jgi:hypothetical protein
LEREHPARIFGWQGAHFVEMLDLIFCELEVQGGEVVL